MSVSRLERHRRLWLEKPVLSLVYSPWFEILTSHAPEGTRVLEVGAGPGLMQAFATEWRPDLRWIALDIHAAAWNDLAADATRLPLRDGTIDAVLGLDLLHHLASPARFFAEAARVLDEGGRLALVEPWITPLSWPVFRFLHHERCRLGVDPWRPFPAGDKDSFEGDAAVPWRLARLTDASRWRAMGLDPPNIRPLNGFAYLLSRGFHAGSLLPWCLAPHLIAFDRVASALAPWTGLRAVLAWRKAQPAASRLTAAATEATAVRSTPGPILDRSRT
jgi:SAM-dependent methyltransferase